MVIRSPHRPRVSAYDRPVSGRPRVLASWLADKGEAPHGPVTVTQMGLGCTNATWLVTDQARRQWVLRERINPDPRSFDREAALLTRLRAAGRPVPEVVGHGQQRGRHFMVLRFVPGVVIDDEIQASRLNAAQRRRLGESIIDTLAGLHTVDPRVIGLPVFGSSHLDRQIAAVSDVWMSSGTSSVHDSAWCALRTRLLTRRPMRESRARVVHGDYRLANIVTREDAQVLTVVDWERCTAGNPLMDLAWLLNSWRAPGEPIGCPLSPTRIGGFSSREELAGFYADRTDIDLHEVNFYRALAYWTSATLLQAAETRRRADASRQLLGNVDDEITFSLIEAASLLRRPTW